MRQLCKWSTSAQVHSFANGGIGQCALDEVLDDRDMGFRMVGQATIDDYFVCIGAQKAGTTWLARVLAHHPEIFLTPVKEIHYFDHIFGISEHLSGKKRRSRHRKYFQKHFTQLHRWPEFQAQRFWYRHYMSNPIDDTWYRALFVERQGKRYAGEATPEYAIIGRDGFLHIRKLAPRGRILFIVRNPVARSWSQVLHHIRAHPDDAHALNEQELIKLLDSRRFEAIGDYVATLDNLTEAFPAEQIMVEFYEDIHRDRLGGLERICSFIGAEFDARWFPDTERLYNRSQRGAMPDGVRRHLRLKYKHLAEDIGSRLGRLPQGWEQEFGL